MFLSNKYRWTDIILIWFQSLQNAVMVVHLFDMFL